MINIENRITRTGWRLILISFRPTSPFYTSWNHQKTRSFQDAYNCNIGLKWVKNGKLLHVSPKKCQHKYHLAFSFYPQLNPRKKLVRVVEIMQLETATGVMSNKIKSDKYIKDWIHKYLSFPSMGASPIMTPASADFTCIFGSITKS